MITPPELAARLDGVKLLFVGESHTDIEFHEVQLRVIQELHERGRQVLVGLEMYPVAASRRGSTAGLGQGARPRRRFLAESHWYKNWGYHWNYYRDIFLFARAERDPRCSASTCRARSCRRSRTKGFDALTPEQRALLPERIDTENAEHQRLFRAFFGADGLAARQHARRDVPGDVPRAVHLGRGDGAGTRSRRSKKHGGEKAIMVVLIGSGHVAYGLGAERQARLWFDGKTASVIPVPVARRGARDAASSKVQASYADFVWGLPPSTDPLYPSVGISTPEQKSGERYKVIMVGKESPAAAAGFKVGDELVSMDGVADHRQGDGQPPDVGEALGRRASSTR